MAKKITGASLARELCAEYPDTPSKTLGRMLYEKHKTRFSTLNSAYCAIRVARGNMGEWSRKWKDDKVARPNQKAGWKPECPPSSAEPWLPFVLDTPCRVLSLSDVHIPYHDKQALEAAVKFGKKLKPDVLLLNGDYGDFYRLSRFQHDPAKRMFVYEAEMMEHGLSWLRGQFPKARMIYKMGNHDNRWDHWVWNKCVELWGLKNLQLQNVLNFENYGITRVDDNPILAGELPILHGHEVEKGAGSTVSPSRTLFLRLMHTSLVGHHHKSSSHGGADLFHKYTFCWSQGCLCDLSPEYARTNQWNHGFAFIDVAKDKQFNLSNYRIDGGRVYS